MHVVATAGHVDHGKSTLVRALTGTDPDRLAEEKRRGLTIELGFAATTTPSGTEIAFVDVPGHERFISNMLAGVGSVSSVLFVVDATEGWKPQSEEHLRIVDLLGVQRGVIALTKADLAQAPDDADVSRVERRRAEVRDRVAGTVLDGAPLVVVDAVSGRGLLDLLVALDDLAAAHDDDLGDRPRLWIDRRFVVAGAGTVVTGTLTGGAIEVGDRLQALPGPAGPGAPASASASERAVEVRVRGMESFGRAVEHATPGTRVALNVAPTTGATDGGALGRGAALVRAEQWRPTTMFDASLTVLDGLSHDVDRRGAYNLHVGSGAHRVQLRLLGATRLRPGERGAVRVHLPRPLPLVMGDRFVLREDGRHETVGGGVVLDVHPVLPAARAAPTPSVDRVIAERGWVEVGDLEALTGERRRPAVGSWLARPEVIRATTQALLEAVAAGGDMGIDASTLGRRDRALLDEAPEVHLVRGRYRLGEDDPVRSHPFLAQLEAAPFAPPDHRGVAPDALRDLIGAGLAVRRDGTVFAASAIDAAATVVAGLLADAPDGIGIGEVRDALGTSRKFALPLMAELDARGITRREGDVRVGGPRLPPPPT